MSTSKSTVAALIVQAWIKVQWRIPDFSMGASIIRSRTKFFEPHPFSLKPRPFLLVSAKKLLVLLTNPSVFLLKRTEVS